MHYPVHNICDDIPPSWAVNKSFKLLSIQLHELAIKWGLNIFIILIYNCLRSFIVSIVTTLTGDSPCPHIESDNGDRQANSHFHMGVLFGDVSKELSGHRRGNNGPLGKSSKSDPRTSTTPRWETMLRVCLVEEVTDLPKARAGRDVFHQFQP